MRKLKSFFVIASTLTSLCGCITTHFHYPPEIAPKAAHPVTDSPVAVCCWNGCGNCEGEEDKRFVQSVADSLMAQGYFSRVLANPASSASRLTVLLDRYSEEERKALRHNQAIAEAEKAECSKKPGSCGKSSFTDVFYGIMLVPAAVLGLTIGIPSIDDGPRLFGKCTHTKDPAANVVEVSDRHLTWSFGLPMQLLFRPFVLGRCIDSPSAIADPSFNCGTGTAFALPKFVESLKGNGCFNE